MQTLSLMVLSTIASVNNGDTMPLSHGGFGYKYTPAWLLLLGP
jgi:hypothetical protein